MAKAHLDPPRSNTREQRRSRRSYHLNSTTRTTHFLSSIRVLVVILLLLSQCEPCQSSSPQSQSQSQAATASASTSASTSSAPPVSSTSKARVTRGRDRDQPTLVTWINGIGFNLSHMTDGVPKISGLFGHCPIHYCHNPTSMETEGDLGGWVGDLAQCGAQKYMSKCTTEVDELIVHLKDAIAKVRGLPSPSLSMPKPQPISTTTVTENADGDGSRNDSSLLWVDFNSVNGIPTAKGASNGRVILIAHSQGALITYLAIKSGRLTQDEMRHMEVICFGGGEAIRSTPETPFARCMNYYSVNDPLLFIVPSAAKALRSGFGMGGFGGGRWEGQNIMSMLGGEGEGEGEGSGGTSGGGQHSSNNPFAEPEFVFLTPRGGDPILDHGLFGPTYIDALRWEGRRYQSLYLPPLYSVTQQSLAYGQSTVKKMEQFVIDSIKNILYRVLLGVVTCRDYGAEKVALPLMSFLTLIVGFMRDIIRRLRGEDYYEPVNVEMPCGGIVSIGGSGSGSSSGSDNSPSSTVGMAFTSAGTSLTTEVAAAAVVREDGMDVPVEVEEPNDEK